MDAGGNPKPTEATFTATDEDDNTDNPDWSNISYDLYYDADLTDDAMNRDELYGRFRCARYCKTRAAP